MKVFQWWKFFELLEQINFNSPLTSKERGLWVIRNAAEYKSSAALDEFVACINEATGNADKDR